MTCKPKVVVTINSNGRQAASFIRCAVAIGWHVRGHIHRFEGTVCEELIELENVSLFEGNLQSKDFVQNLFKGADLAFINTTHWNDEVAIGKLVADTAKKVGVQHYIYSSMPDHSVYGKGWRTLPWWGQKFIIENYVREIGLPATFIYTGIYHNNFTGLNYPLFRMQHLEDDSFLWEAPFDPDRRLPWLDSEHDVGPAVLQIFKIGPHKLGGKTIPLAFEYLTPREVCKQFAAGIGRPVLYKKAPIKIEVNVPAGYREHLQSLETTLAKQHAPYFGPDLDQICVKESVALWEGFRDMEEYAREAFPVEEEANGLTWMKEGDQPQPVLEGNFPSQTAL